MFFVLMVLKGGSSCKNPRAAGYVATPAILYHNKNIHIRAIQRECCIIMGGRNNQLCDQKGQNPKGVEQAKKPTKRNPAVGQKNHFKCIWQAKKTTKLNYTNNKRTIKIFSTTSNREVMVVPK